MSKTEQKLKESEEKYRLLVENTNAAITLFDENGTYLFLNNIALQWIKSMGLSLEVEDIIDKKNLHDIFSKDVADFFLERIHKIFKSGAEVTNEERVEDLNRWISSNHQPVRDQEGKIIAIQIITQDITKRKKVEQKLKESEIRYKQLFETSPYAIVLMDRDGYLIDCNNAIKKYMSMHSKLDVIGRSYKEILSFNKKNKDLITLFEAHFDKILKEEPKEPFEIQLYQSKGGFLWCHVQGSRVQIGNKELVQFIIQDITDRKKAEQKLKKSEEKYRNLVENTQEGVWVVDENNDTIFVNPKICEMLGCNKDEMRGKNLDLFLDDSMLELTNSYRERREKGLKDTYDLEFIKKDGTIIYTRVKAAPILNENGEFKCSFAYITDITNRKKAEQKLKESEEKYRLITENANDIIAVLDDKFRPEYINETPLNKMLGYNSVDFIGKSAFLVIHPDDRKMVLNGLIKGSKVGEGISEARLRHKDGHYIWVESRGKTFIDGNGEKKILLNIRNIAERKKAEKEINNALDEIKRSNAELEQFAYVASHDLQEPLRMVSGFANLLEKRFKESLDEDAHDFIDFIIDGTTRMHNLINDLLTFSRIGTRGKVFKPTDMNVVLEATLNNVRISAIETNSIITNDPLPVIIADESQMVQLLQNLISNAIKFHGSVPPKIHVSGEIKKNEWVFTIRDNGIGIDSKDFERIFVIFQRLHKKGEYSGTGIGLAVCKKIIQRHGGKIWVESELKKESTFYFSIPRN